MGENNRPAIPEAIKREVRQRCGFGCVICGLPLYEYEHMKEWAKVKRHVADEITLLCRKHHGEKTDRLLPIDKVFQADKEPYNLKNGVSRNVLLHYSGNEVEFMLGSCSFYYPALPMNSFAFPLVIDDTAIIGFMIDKGGLSISFSAFDELNNPVLAIDRNELIYSAYQWDIEWVGKILTIREGRGKILLQLYFEPPKIIKVVKGRILFNGIELLVGSDYLFCTNSNNYLERGYFYNCRIGLALGNLADGSGTAMKFARIPRYDVDRKSARKKLREIRSKERQNKKR